MGNWQKEIARARYLINTTFGKLRFVEESHQYFLPQEDGTELEYDCVSNFTKQWDTTTEEDWDKIRQRYAEKHGETADYWKKVWAENAKVACEGGTLVHEFAESCGWVTHGETDRICKSAQSQYDVENNRMIPLNDGSKWALKQQAVRNFYDNLHPNLHFVMAETKVYTSVGPFSEKYVQNYAGTFDLLMYYDDPNDDSKSGFVIMDWKTNGSLTSNYSKTPYLQAPFSELKEEAQSHYTLQLSCYQIPMESIGLKVIARRLIWLQDNGELQLVPLPNVTDRIKEALRKPRRTNG